MQYQVLWLWLQNKSPVSSLLNISSTNYYYRAFAGDVVVKNQPVNAGDAGDLGSIFGLGRSPGIGNGNPIQYSCLDNSMDRGTWWVTVHGVAKSMTWLSTHTHTHTHTHKYHYNPIHNSKWIQFSSVQSLSCVWLFVTPWTAARQVSLSITNFWSLLKLMSIDSVMPSNHLILCHPLLLLPLIFPSIKVFSNEPVLHIRWPKYWSFSFSISPSNEYSGLISFRMDWLDLLAVQGTL